MVPGAADYQLDQGDTPFWADDDFEVAHGRANRALPSMLHAVVAFPNRTSPSSRLRATVEMSDRRISHAVDPMSVREVAGVTLTVVLTARGKLIPSRHLPTLLCSPWHRPSACEVDSDGDEEHARPIYRVWPFSQQGYRKQR
jgi:hypothetical protein